MPVPPDIVRLRAIDAVADRFDAAWSAGQTPRIEEFLSEAPAEWRSAVLTELLAIELEWRTRRGLAVSPDDFRRRFAQESAAVNAALADWSRDNAGRSSARSASSTAVTSQSDDSSVVQTVLPDQAATTPDAAAGVERIGRYRIVRQLGAGAMGVVYLAVDEELQRQVALKVPKPELDRDGGLTERFLREARAAATLNHPNICAVYDIGEAAGVRYITMAYIDGKPLQQITRGGRQHPERQAALLIRKLALALQVAHDNGVVHRDLKPANILLDQKHDPVIMDFGLALLTNRQEDARLTKSGVIVGSPAYMSPEQVSGDPNAVGPSSDIYSLGVILYELLTGRLPFLGNVMAVIGQIQTADPPAIRTLRPEVDPGLEAIVARMMARSLDRRYASMKEVADDLTAWLKGGGPSVVMEQPSAAASLAAIAELDAQQSRRRRPAASHKPPRLRRAVLAAAVLLAAVLGVVFIVRTPQGDVRIETNDDRIGVELDGQRITLTDRSWQGRKRVGARRLNLLVNGVRVPIGESLPITVDGQPHRLTAALGDLQLSGHEFEVQRGNVAVLKIALLPVALPAQPVTSSESPQPVEKTASAQPAIDFRSRVQPQPKVEDHFHGDYKLQQTDGVQIALENGRLVFELKASGSSFMQRNQVSYEQGLLEIDVRSLDPGGAWRVSLSNMAIGSLYQLWIEHGALQARAIVAGRSSPVETLSTNPPLRTDGGFDRLQLLVQPRRLEVALNGRPVGEPIEMPFQAAPGWLMLGVSKLGNGSARVEYDRVAYYPLLGLSPAPDDDPPIPADRIASAGMVIDLLKVTPLENMFRHGPWVITADGWHCAAVPAGFRRLELPIHPRGDYDVEVEFTSGSEANATLRLPLGLTGQAADLTLASYNGGAMGIVIRDLTMLQLPEPVGRRPSPVKAGQRHTAVARIRKTGDDWSITGLIDGEEQVRWSGSPAELSLHQAWQTGDLKRPMIGQWITKDATFTVHAARLKVVSEAAHLLPEPSRTVPPSAVRVVSPGPSSVPATPSPSAADPRTLIELRPTFAADYNKVHEFHNDREASVTAGSGQLTVHRKLPHRGGGWWAWHQADFGEGLLETEVRRVGERGGWLIVLHNPQIERGVSVFCRDGKLYSAPSIFDARISDPRTITVLTANPPLQGNDQFDSVQLLVRTRSVQVYLNGQSQGAPIETPFDLTPGSIRLGVLGSDNGDARVEYRRLEFRRLKTES